MVIPEVCKNYLTQKESTDCYHCLHGKDCHVWPDQDKLVALQNGLQLLLAALAEAPTGMHAMLLMTDFPQNIRKLLEQSK